MTTNFGQPLFGYLVDRWRLRNLIPWALLVSAVFTCTVGFVSSLWGFVAFLMISGLGVALFHPRGAALAAAAAGRRHAFGMSVFAAGGAAGLILAAGGAPLLDIWGQRLGLRPLQGFLLALPLGLAAVVLMWRYNPQDTRLKQPPPLSLRTHLLPYLKPLAPLLGVMVLRSCTVVAFSNFYQVLQGERGYSKLYQGMVLLIFAVGGASGGFMGGHLYDRHGRRAVTVLSLLLSPPLLYYALYAPSPYDLVLLFLAGFTLRGAEPVNISQTQALLPQSASLASAIAMGFSWGVAGIIAPIVGLTSDRTHNLSLALAATALLPVIAAFCALAIRGKAPAETQ